MNAPNIQDQVAKFFVPVVTVIPLNSVSIIGWSFVACGAISLTVVSGLYLFQLSKRRRFERQHDIIDTVAISCNYEDEEN